MIPNEPWPDRPPREWLAAFADGELDGAARRAVEDWLRHDAAARADLEAQNRFSPANEAFWQAASPPDPGPAAWEAARLAVEHALYPPPSPGRPGTGRRAWWLAGALAFVTTAAAVFVGVLAIERQQPAPPNGPQEVVEDDADAVFRLASADDVEIISLPEAARAMLVVGDDPLRGAEFKPARFEDVDIRGIGPGPGGDFPELHMTPHGVSSPMVWAPASE